MFLRPLFADDIFISYARKDSSTYATGLADELTKRGFSCFIDRLVTEANPVIPKSLRRKLRSCGLLIVVGTEWSGTRVSIKEEIIEFKKTKRPIVPIDVDGTIHEAIWYEDIEGIAPEVEHNPKALSAGDPSPSVVSRVEKSFKYLKRNQKLRRWTIGTAAVLLVLIGVSVAAARKAANEVARAEQARLVADEAMRAADAAKKQADEAKIAAERARDEANKQRELADAATKKAREQTELARVASAEATKQQGIALGRLTASSADSRRLRSQGMDQGWSDMLNYSVALALEAAKRLSSLGVAPADAYQSLRESLNLLPRFIKPYEHDHAVVWALLTPDGKFLITKEDDDFLRVWNFESHALIRETKVDDRIILSADRMLMATVDAQRQMFVREVLTGKQLVQLGPVGDRDPQFSADGKYIVAPVATSDSKSRNVVVWESRSGKPFREVKYAGELRGFALSNDNGSLALSLVPISNSEQQAQASGGECECGQPPEDNSIQIWNVKDPAVLVSETKVPLNEEGAVNCPLVGLTFSPDGNFLAGSTEYHALVMRVRGSHDFVRIDGPSRDPCNVTGNNVVGIQLLAFSSDSTKLGTVGDKDMVTQTWDVYTGAQVWSSMDGAANSTTPFVVIADDLGQSVVDVRNGKEIARLLSGQKNHGIMKDDNNEEWSIDFAAEKDRLLLSKSRQVWLYDIGSAQEEARLTYSAGAQLTHNRFGDKYVALTDGDKVLVWNPSRAREVARLQHENEVSRDLRFSWDWNFVVTATTDNTLHVWDIRTGQEVRRVHEPLITVKDDEGYLDFNVDSLSLSPSGKFVVLKTNPKDDDSDANDEDDQADKGKQQQSTQDTFQIWRVSDGAKVVSGDYDRFYFSPDEQFIVLRGMEFIQVYNAVSGTLGQPISIDSSGYAFEFSPSARMIARTVNGEVEVSEVNGPTLYRVKPASDNPMFEFSPGGRFLVVINDDSRKMGEIVVAATGRPVAKLKFETPIHGFEFSPSGAYLVTHGERAGKKGDVGVWEVATGRRVARLETESNVVNQYFSADERRIAINAFQGRVSHVVNLKTGKVEKELRPDGDIENVTFSSDGRLVAVTTGERVVVWETDRWQEKARLRQGGEVTWSKFVANGRQLATVSSDGTARIWVLTEDELVARACERLVRGLSPSEWQDNFGQEIRRTICRSWPSQH
jgi:WD40 repeat protein